MKIKKFSIYVMFIFLLVSFVYAGTTNGVITWDNELNFNSGTYVNTYWNGSDLVLNNSFTDGSYCSAIENSTGNNTYWDTLKFNDSQFKGYVNLGDSVLIEDWETGDFNSESNLWALDSRIGWYNAGSSDISINSYSGVYALRLTGNTGYVDRGINFSKLNGDVLISFMAKCNSFETGEEAYFDIELENNSENYFNLKTWVNTDCDNIWRNYNFNLSDYSNINLSENNEISFSAGMSGSGDYFFIDNLNITFPILDVYINSSLNFKVRSCNNTLCNTGNYTDILDVSPVNLNINNGTYFQFCSDFSTTNLNYIPYINSVDVNFSFITVVNDTNITINPVGCNFVSDVILIYPDYPYIEKDVYTTLAWRIHKKGDPNIVITNISTSNIFINGEWFNLTFNPSTYNYEVTLLFNKTGDYNLDYPFRLYFKEDLSDLCTLTWYNGEFRIREYANLDIELYTNYNQSKYYENSFAFLYIEVINEGMTEKELWGGLAQPIKIANFWLDKLIVEVTGVKLELFEEDNKVLYGEKVFKTSLGIDGTETIRIPTNENMILKIMGVNTNQAIDFLHGGYTYMWYVPNDIKFNSDLTYLNIRNDTIMQIVVTDLDTNPSWYYARLFLIIGGILLILLIPFGVYAITRDMAQATKVFISLLVAIPSIIAVIIFIGGFLT